jgi:hypothetical protein
MNEQTEETEVKKKRPVAQLEENTKQSFAKVKTDVTEIKSLLLNLAKRVEALESYAKNRR